MIFVVLESESGGWGEWSPWTPCSSTCIGGTRNRYRFCDSPPPRYGAKFCEVISCPLILPITPNLLINCAIIKSHANDHLFWVVVVPPSRCFLPQRFITRLKRGGRTKVIFNIFDNYYLFWHLSTILFHFIIDFYNQNGTETCFKSICKGTRQ